MTKAMQNKYNHTVDLFDFDHTVYRGDASLDFFFFSLRREPRLAIYMPLQVLGAVMFLLRLSSRTEFKQRFFVFLKGIRDVESEVGAFWDDHEKKIKTWYMERDHESEVIISASPEFIIAPISDRMGVHKLLATIMDPKTGRIKGRNCRGEEKVRRFRLEFKDATIGECYSDSLSDLPILSLAERAYIVRGDRLMALDEYKKSNR